MHCSQIRYATEQGILQREQGIASAEQGICRADQAKILELDCCQAQPGTVLLVSSSAMVIPESRPPASAIPRRAWSRFDGNLRKPEE
jgi:hypothetical protein